MYLAKRRQARFGRDDKSRTPTKALDKGASFPIERLLRPQI